LEEAAALGEDDELARLRARSLRMSDWMGRSRLVGKAATTRELCNLEPKSSHLVRCTYLSMSDPGAMRKKMVGRRG
jgi:hypothetical protein